MMCGPGVVVYVLVVAATVVGHWGWLVHGANNICDQLCHCHKTQEDLNVMCISTDLSVIPVDLPANITQLELSINPISELTASSFPSSLHYVNRLTINMCDVRKLDAQAFSPLASLVELSLDHNKINFVAPGAFLSCSKLRVISLSNNELLSLENNTFRGLNLTNLNLNGNNHLMELVPGVFNSASVDTLSMDHCSLSTVSRNTLKPLRKSLRILHWSSSRRPVNPPNELFSGFHLDTLYMANDKLVHLGFLGNARVVHLDLKQNHFNKIDLGAIPGLQWTEYLNLAENGLQELTLSHTAGAAKQFSMKDLRLNKNYLASLDATIFQHMVNLSHLDLSYNNIHSLSDVLAPVFNHLEFVDLSGNGLWCDCTLEWLGDWARDKEASHILHGAQCAMPKLADLVAVTHMPCHPPRIVQLANDSSPTDLLLACEGTGLPLPTLTWHINITASARFAHPPLTDLSNYISSHAELEAFINTSTLKLPFNQQNNSCAIFSCTATNAAGSDTAYFSTCVGTYELSAQALPRSTGKDPEKTYMAFLVPVLAIAAALLAAVFLVIVGLRYGRAPLKAWLHSRSSNINPVHKTQEGLLIEDTDDDPFGSTRVFPSKTEEGSAKFTVESL